MSAVIIGAEVRFDGATWIFLMPFHFCSRGALNCALPTRIGKKLGGEYFRGEIKSAKLTDETYGGFLGGPQPGGVGRRPSGGWGQKMGAGPQSGARRSAAGAQPARGVVTTAVYSQEIWA